MTNDEIKLVVKTTVDQMGLDKGLKDVEKKVKHTTEKSESMFKSMFKALTLEKVIDKGFEKVTEFLESSIEKSREAEVNAAQLRNTLSTFGKGDYFGEIMENAEQLSLRFLVTKDSILGSQEQLETYGKLTEDQIKKLLPIIINYSKKQRISMEEATNNVIKGLNGQGKALKTLGVDLKKGGTITENYATVVEKLGIKVDGAADAFNNTSEGGLAKFNVATTELQETIGGGLTPVLGDLYGIVGDIELGFVKVIKFLEDHSEIWTILEGTIVGLGAAYVVYNAQMLYNNTLQVINAVKTGISTIATEGFAAAMGLAEISATAMWAAATLGLSLFITGIIVAYQKIDKFRAFINGLGAAFMSLGKVIKGVGELILGAFTLDVNMFKQGLKDVKQGAEDVGKAYEDAYNKTIKDADDARKKEVEENKKKNEKIGKQDDDNSKKKKKTAEQEANERKKQLNKELKDLEAHYKLKVEMANEGSLERLQAEREEANATIGFYEQTGKTGKKVYEELGLTTDEWALKKLELNKKVSADDKKYDDDRKKESEDTYNEIKKFLEKQEQDKIKAAEDGLKQLEAIDEEQTLHFKEGTIEREEAEIKSLNDKRDYYKAHKDELFKTDADYNLAVAKLDEQTFNKKQKLLEDEKRKQREVFDETLSDATNLANGLNSLNDLVASIKSNHLKKGSKEAEEEGKKSFNRAKKIQMGLAIISGLEGIVNAISAKSIVPEPFGSILKGVNAVAIAATTAANVAKIDHTSYEGGGSNPSAPPTPSPTAGGTFDIGMATKTFKAPSFQSTRFYVTESDISKTQNKVSVVQSRATLK